MASARNRIPVPGSERTLLPGARMMGAADPHERILVTVLLRRRAASRELTSMITEMGMRSPHTRQHLSREAFAATHGMDPNDLEKIEEFAHEYDLDVVEVYPAQRRVVLSGMIAALSAAFGVPLAQYAHAGGTYRGRTGPLQLPDELAPLIQGVFGLDNRPQARPHFRLFPGPKGAVQPHAAGTSFTPPQIAKLYDFPTGVNGSGQCIAIIELGGGYRKADLNAYFAQLGIPMPRVRSKSVDGGHNHPTTPDSADGEVLLDIEVAGAVAPGAKIVVYFAPNTDAGFLDAITTAIHDTQNHPSVISISWGGPEVDWTPQAMQAMDQAFQDAAALGVTVCCASGDDGSSDIRPPQPDDHRLHADFPASSPYALACGGTHLQGTGSSISSEVVWNQGRNGGATGGGVSDVFALPSWQASTHVPPSGNPGGHVGRGLPEMAANADPATGYQIQVDGQQGVIGGTS